MLCFELGGQSPVLGREWAPSLVPFSLALYRLLIEAGQCSPALLASVSLLLSLAPVGLSAQAMLLSREYPVRELTGAGGPIIVPVKITPGIPGMTNFLCTGLVYVVWPIAVGIGLLREPRQGTP